MPSAVTGLALGFPERDFTSASSCCFRCIWRSGPTRVECAGRYYRLGCPKLVGLSHVLATVARFTQHKDGQDFGAGRKKRRHKPLVLQAWLPCLMHGLPISERAGAIAP